MSLWSNNRPINQLIKLFVMPAHSVKEKGFLQVKLQLLSSSPSCSMINTCTLINVFLCVEIQILTVLSWLWSYSDQRGQSKMYCSLYRAKFTVKKQIVGFSWKTRCISPSQDEERHRHGVLLTRCRVVSLLLRQRLFSWCSATREYDCCLPDMFRSGLKMVGREYCVKIWS